MNFHKKVKSSVYDPAYYSEVINSSFGSSLKYFFKLIILIAFIGSIYASFIVIPNFNSLVKNFGNELIDTYPSELEIKFKNGVVSTNVTEPYIIPVPKDEINKDYGKLKYDNLLVIDTKSDFTMEKFSSYNTVILLTKNAVVSRDNNKITITDLKDVTNFTINHENLVYWVNKFTPIVKVIPFAIPFAIFIGLLIFYSFNLFYLLFASLLVFILGKIRKQGLSYKKSYQVSLHALTLPLILTVLFSELKIHIFLFLPTVILLIVVWFNVKKVESVSPIV